MKGYLKGCCAGIVMGVGRKSWCPAIVVLTCGQNLLPKCTFDWNGNYGMQTASDIFQLMVVPLTFLTYTISI